MKHLSLLFITVLCLLPLPMVAAPSFAEPSVVELHPVMIIRFNQPNISFQQQLSMVLNRARAIKPSVAFDLIQYIPATDSRSRLAGYEQHKKQVLGTFASSGVDAKQVNFAQSVTPDVSSDEIYIFVR